MALSNEISNKLKFQTRHRFTYIYKNFCRFFFLSIYILVELGGESEKKLSLTKGCPNICMYVIFICTIYKHFVNIISTRKESDF